MNQNANVWEERVRIPTYKTAEPEKGPLFLENRAYQGSSGKVYPLPVTEKLSDIKEDVEYRAVFLENDYLKIMVLPELGGRIQRAYDKTNGYDFVYYNHVIKPALVGLTGPWISGGIEFNWPQHHRPGTYAPVDVTFFKRPDGSATVFVSEIDKMYGTKGMASFTLYPDKAYLEVKGQLFNPTELPQTFLWWANPAVPVNDHTCSVFPPDVHAVMDHGKRAVSTFPIATGEYYKYDYSAGVDISMYKNIKVPTSYMAAHSDFDFIGNYDESRQAGLLHVADHHISPGKKQWTWGNADFGRAWDRNLTDTDGPYIELMTGVFADNQPDFTWLKPYEEKTFVQYFLPYKGVGRVKNATKDAAVNFTIADGQAALRLYTSGRFPGLTISVTKDDAVLYRKTADTDPQTVFSDTFPTSLPSADGCLVCVCTADGKILVRYQAKEQKPEPVPKPAKPIGAPSELATAEDLYFAAQHLEQYRHATREPADYYLEGLRRDPSDLRLNNGYGLLLLRRGQFEEARQHFARAVEKQTRKNPNPYHGESFFNLGLALTFLGQDEAAYDAFYKATWSMETQGAGFYQLSVLCCKKGDYEQALAFAERSLIYNWHNMNARTLKAAILRALERDADAFLSESLAIDPLSMGCLYEQGCAEHDLSGWKIAMRSPAHNYLELALFYQKAGFYRDALAILHAADEKTPMVFYYEGQIHLLRGDSAAAKAAFETAEQSDPDYCFPNRLEEIGILKSAVSFLKAAPFAHYYLGCLLYDKKQYEAAAAHWEASIRENDSYAMAFRNLAIAGSNKQNRNAEALRLMERALTLCPSYPRFLLEYDRLAAKTGVSVTERLARMEQYPALLPERDALWLEYITLLNTTKQYDRALDALAHHTFHPWEGGEGKVSEQYRFALTEKALLEIRNEHWQEAEALLQKTFSYPENLGEGKLPNVQDTIAEYYIGICRRALGDEEGAVRYFTLASVGLDEPAAAIYYNEQPSDTIYYQGLAFEALQKPEQARRAYHQLKFFGEQHMFDAAEYDFFAVSLPELEVFPTDIRVRNLVCCRYLTALGELGLGHLDAAASIFAEVLALQPDHQGALRHMPKR